MPVEMTPLQTRGKSVAISTGLFWLCNFFVVMISPALISRIGYGTYVLWACTNLCFIPMIYFLGKRPPYPRLKHPANNFDLQFRKPARLPSKTSMSCSNPIRRGSSARYPRKSWQISQRILMCLMTEMRMDGRRRIPASIWSKIHRPIELWYAAYIPTYFGIPKALSPTTEQ